MVRLWTFFFSFQPDSFTLKHETDACLFDQWTQIINANTVYLNTKLSKLGKKLLGLNEMVTLDLNIYDFS